MCQTHKASDSDTHTTTHVGIHSREAFERRLRISGVVVDYWRGVGGPLARVVVLVPIVRNVPRATLHRVVWSSLFGITRRYRMASSGWLPGSSAEQHNCESLCGRSRRSHQRTYTRGTPISIAMPSRPCIAAPRTLAPVKITFIPGNRLDHSSGASGSVSA